MTKLPKIHGKQRAMYSYDTLNLLTYEEEFPEGQEEVYDFLRTKIAMLSALYRDIIVLYYFDGLSTKQISEKLHIPEGTITWRLSEARKKLKKECDTMNESAWRSWQSVAGYPHFTQRNVCKIFSCVRLCRSPRRGNVCGLAQEKGLLIIPPAGSVCDVLVQYK